MTLGIAIKTPYHGIALGSDSLVSVTQDWVKMNDLDEVITLIKSFDPASDKAELIKKLLGLLSSKEIVVNNFRSGKMFPIGKYEGRYLGATMFAGNQRVMEAQHLARMRIEYDPKEPFLDYVKTLLMAICHVLGRLTNNKQSINQIVFAGYCPIEHEYKLYRANIRLVMTEKGEIEVSNPEFSECNVAMIGESQVSEALLTGTSGEMDHIVLNRFQKTLKSILIETFGANHYENGNLDNARGKIAQIACSSTETRLDDSILETILTNLSDNGYYDAKSDVVRIKAMVETIVSLACAAINAQNMQDRHNNHLAIMTLPELLHVIEFLISTTARVHEYIKAGIPTVGGEITFGAVTTDGFQFHKIGDSF